jgi:RNA recognition motif-containing protein
MTSIPKQEKSSNTRIFVRGLPVRIEKDTIVEFFSKFGVVEHCKLKRNNKTKRSMGYACITFQDPTVAQSLIDQPIDFFGRICECKPVLKTKDLEEHLNLEKKLKVKLVNLDVKTTNQDLLQVLSSLTTFSYAYVVKEQPDSDENKGFGFIMFSSNQEASAFSQNFRYLFIKGKKVQVVSEESSLRATNREQENKKAGMQPTTFQAVGSSFHASLASSESCVSHSKGIHTSDTRHHLRQSNCPIDWPKSEKKEAGNEGALRIQESSYSLWSTHNTSRHISSGNKAFEAFDLLPELHETHCADSLSGKKSSSPSQTDHSSYRSLSRFNRIAYVSRQIDERVENYRFNSTPNSSLGKNSKVQKCLPNQRRPNF